MEMIGYRLFQKIMENFPKKRVYFSIIADFGFVDNKFHLLYISVSGFYDTAG